MSIVILHFMIIMITIMIVMTIQEEAHLNCVGDALFFFPWCADLFVHRGATGLDPVIRIRIIIIVIIIIICIFVIIIIL